MGGTVAFSPVEARRRLGEIERRMRDAYGTRHWRRHGDPLSALVATVLSQHTSDVNTARAFASLRARFPTWEEVRTAPPAEVEDAIRGGGLARIKAGRLQRILDAVRSDHGTLALDDLAGLGKEGARAYLLGLPGVGPKTTACVLLFALGIPAMPVDTHVHRVALRLGLVPAGTTAAAAHPLLEALIGEDRDRVYAFHLNAIAHGRAICRARTPRCAVCPLQECCDYFNRSRLN